MIKGKCVAIKDNKVGFTFNSSMPVVGREYLLEDGVTGTNAQNSLFHALLQEFFGYMLRTDTFMIEDNCIAYDLRCPDWFHLKDILKQRYGKGFSHINYVDNNKIISVKKFSDIPLYVLDDFNNGNKERIKGVLVSWSKYTRNQRMKLIDFTILLMDRFGVDSKKYFEIIEGLNNDEIKDNTYINKIERVFK